MSNTELIADAAIEPAESDDPGEFGAGCDIGPGGRYWRERAGLWRSRAIARGWGSEQPPADLNSIAHTIAEESAIHDIETYCEPFVQTTGSLQPGNWYDTTKPNDLMADWIARGVSYLEARSKLVRHPANANAVRVCFTQGGGRG